MIEQKDGIQIIEIYGDESGSISKNRKFPFFSICFVQPINNFWLKNHFKKWRHSIIKKRNLDIKAEIKGSSLSNDELKEFVDKFLPHVKVFCAPFDCTQASEKFLESSKITYNFIVNKLIQRIMDSSQMKRVVLKLEMDQINNSVQGMDSLEDYLNTTYIENENIIKILVNYYESHSNWKIQVADIFSHYFYRSTMHNSPIDKKINIRKIY